MRPAPNGAAGAGPGAGAAALSGRRVAGGRASVELLTHLLGLEEQSVRYRYYVKAVAWLDHALEASVVIAPENREVVARIERRVGESKAMIATDDLVLYFRTMGADLPRAMVHLVELRAPGRLADYTLETLSGAIAADPELGRPGLPMPPGVDEQERPRSLLDTWGDEGAYADFFAAGEIARAQLDSLDPSNLFFFVQHSDAECAHMNPHSVAPIVWLVNYPWEARDRDRPAPPVREGKQNERFSVHQMITTNLTEDDVIMGNPEKLDRVLAAAHKLHERYGKTIFFSNTCVPVVVGEDVESRVDNFRTACHCPMLYLTVTPRSMVNVYEEVLVTRRLAAEKDAPPPAPASVNLIGFARDGALGELMALLEAVGVTVNAAILPDMEYELIDRMPRAALNVFFPNKLWQHLYDQLTFSSRIPGIFPGAPYGLGATRRWLEEILTALGRAVPDLDERWAAALAPHTGALEELRAAAEGRRVALVVRGEETYYLTRPDSTWGVPLVALLEELGYGLDVLLLVKDRESARRAAGDIHAVFAHPQRHAIKGFNTRELLLERLQASTADAVLTSHVFDWRVTSAGKSPISLQAFEMGVGGAVRTARRLQDACRTPFYRRYGRYLARTPRGLRVGPGGPGAPAGTEAPR